MRLFHVVVFALTACGPMGPPGPEGPTGPVGPPAVPIPVLAWVDANDHIVSTGTYPIFVDNDGLRWTVDTDSGEMTFFRTYAGFGVIYYDTPNCTGPGYAYGGEVLAGTGFSMCGDAETLIRIRGPHDASSLRRIYSSWGPDNAGGCRCNTLSPGSAARVFAIPALRALPSPPALFSGPLRLVNVPTQ